MVAIAEGNYRASVSELFNARLRLRAVADAAELLESNLYASMDDLNALRGAAGFARSWERAGNRLREERLMGLYPKRHTIPASTLIHHVGTVIDEARDGAHMTITEHGERAAVIVSASEYDRLKLDARLLTFEETPREMAPEGWGEE